EIGNQVADIARTEGQIAGEKAKRDPAALAQARAELAATGKPFTEQDVVQRACNTGMAASGFGTGGKYQQAIQAATAAVQGLAGGNLSAALAGGAAPYIAEVIKQTTPDGAGRVAAHAVVNAALAVAQENNALAGAAGAATGEVVGMIATEMYNKPVSELSETEKQTVSTLATVAAGLAGGLVGESGASAITGAQSGRTTVDNNALSVPQIESFAEKAKGCEARGDCGQIVKEMEDLSLNQQKEMIAVCSTDPAACKEKYGDIPANGMLVRKALDGLFDTDVPAEMKNDISSFWAQQMEAEGVVTSTEFASQLESRYGMDKQQSEILAMAVLGAVTGGMGKGGKPGAGASGKNIVVVDSGKKGAWNKAMNKPEPNTVYKVDGNKTYHTDELTRTTNVSASLSLSKNDRNGYQQCKAGKCGNLDDEGGHLIASIFHGPGEKLNLVPMDGNLNKGAWKQMENTWTRALKDGKKVDVNIQPIYSGNNTRPDRVIVKYSIDGGRPVNVDFKNSPGGK
ncbi:filamentous hemagglutinin, partial [Salmonella enterica subsp. enterica serovar Lomalinda]|nr:filamentous hemagglutinin [Salmonella enterica subsp. enterica serovar Lomalinda]